MFKLITEKYIPNLDLTYYQFEHDKTKAQHIHLACDNKENSFMVNFHTLPSSSNGVMHILEHSCLMGSEKFPLKSILFSANKKSINTYSNASTYPDHTCYPFSSANKKDFFNFLEIYLDSAFFPLLNKEVFLQEGWRYEFDENEKLKVNGVVFNEMIGALPTSRRKNIAIINSLYPDTAYGVLSGGYPLEIPNLSYEELKQYHANYYHPSNAQFLTYGNIDCKEIQKSIEVNVLNHFDYKDIKTPISEKQPAFSKASNITINYPYPEPDFASNHGYYKAWALSKSNELEKTITADVICDLMFADSASIMRKKIEKSKLTTKPFLTCMDYGNGLSLILGGDCVKEEDFNKLDNLINQTLKEIITNGFSKEELNKVLHQFELHFKSRKSGGNGLLANLGCSHPKKGVNPLKALEQDKILEAVKEKLQNPEYIKQFVKENILENNHAINLKFMASVKEHEQQQEKMENLAKLKEQSLTAKDKQAIVEQSKQLKKFQSKKDDMSILPEFSTKDISTNFDLQKLEQQEVNGVNITAFTAPTNGLTHYKLTSFIKDIKASDAPYIRIYNYLAKDLGFGDFTYQERAEKEASISAGISNSIYIIKKQYDDTFYAKFNLSSKMLNRNTKNVKLLADDIVENLRFDEKERIVSQLEKLNQRLQQGFTQSAHLTAINLSKAANGDKDSILSFYTFEAGFWLFIKQLVEDIKDDNKYDKLIAKMQDIHSKVLVSFKAPALMVIDGKDNLKTAIKDFADNKIIKKPEKYEIEFDLESIDFNIISSEKTTANYCATAIKAVKHNHELAGAYKVLSKIISSYFTLPELREKGGAYGGNANYRGEYLLMLSYRDPNISKSFNVFKNLATWLADENNLTNERIEEGILMSIGELDKPVLKEIDCMLAFSRYINDIDGQEKINFRKKVLNTNIKQLKLAAEHLINNIPKAKMAAVTNKQQFIKENINLKNIDF